jgi:hypothetical protein
MTKGTAIVMSGDPRKAISRASFSQPLGRRARSEGMMNNHQLRHGDERSRGIRAQ